MTRPHSKLPDCLTPLSDQRRFVVVRIADDSPVAVDDLGRRINPADKSNWLSSTSALARAALRGDQYRPAFVLNGSGVFVFDIPRCTGPADRLFQIGPIITQFRGAALFPINDGRGIRIVGSYRVPMRHDTHNEALAISLRTTGAMPIPVAITDGQGTAGFDATEALNAVVLGYFTRVDDAIIETVQRALDAAGGDQYKPSGRDAVIEFSG